MGALKRGWLSFIKHTLNPLTLSLARSGRGPFSLVRHVGRKSGTAFETPLVLAEVPEGFVAELTYGSQVNWYRNIVVAGGCVVSHKRREYRVIAIEPYRADDGYRAFGGAAQVVLRVLRRHEFRLLRVDPTARDGQSAEVPRAGG